MADKARSVEGVFLPKQVRIGAVRELTLEESGAPRKEPSAVQRFRDSHHALARLCALGHRNVKLVELTGYSMSRIEQLRRDPAFQNLVATYQASVDEDWRTAVVGYFANLAAVRDMSMRMIRDQLEDADETGEKLPIRNLLAIQADAADRSGFPKRSVAVNINLDFASKLEKAIKRSRGATIDHEPAAPEPPVAPAPQPLPAPATDAEILPPLEPVPPFAPAERKVHRVTEVIRASNAREPIRRRA